MAELGHKHLLHADSALCVRVWSGGQSVMDSSVRRFRHNLEND